MQRAWLIACAAVAAALAMAPAAAQGPDVDEIVAKHVAARGGLEKLKAIQTIKITRTVATPFSNLRLVVYRKRPALYRAEQGPAEPGAPLTPRGINATDAWDVQGGKVVLRPAPLAAEGRDLDADFDGLLVDWREKGHTVVYNGRETRPSGQTHKLTVTTRNGATRTIYLDAATYLDRRHTGVLNMPGGRQADVVIDFDNWREIGGVKFPFDISEERTGKQPVQSLVTYTEAIEVNVPLDDALFATPAPKG
jgi:hypothetical protein